ncbi:Zn-ribbon domain-containing OB-fold protein [Flavisphingomonas formosensis]|uniref:Zn-ribbon domain-containing OB-fold protein n=1 Tax=Flavisphingomonas formosensis TaxID=861534 RepID=UPI0012FB2C19|nr:OB-fold domain-containing protein [Sphingomonas formosensis]
MTAGFPLPDTTDPRLAPFWEAAAQGELRLPRRVHGTGFDWYPSGAEVEWVRLPGTGRLFTWSVVERPLHSGYAGITPYVSALVELDGAPGVRLVTRLLEAPDRLTIGAPVIVRFTDLGTPGPETAVIAPLFVLHCVKDKS